eukprot:m51a1_g3456 hypothetical protein (210) ;mRNA; f:689211-689898
MPARAAALSATGHPSSLSGTTRLASVPSSALLLARCEQWRYIDALADRSHAAQLASVTREFETALAYIAQLEGTIPPRQTKVQLGRVSAALASVLAAERPLASYVSTLDDALCAVRSAMSALTRASNRLISSGIALDDPAALDDALTKEAASSTLDASGVAEALRRLAQALEEQADETKRAAELERKRAELRRRELCLRSHLELINGAI